MSRSRKESATARSAAELAQSPDLEWVSLTLRITERGWLVGEFARQSIWTIDGQGRVRQETLLLKREPKRIRYTLTNAPVTGDFLTQAFRKCQRYFVERSRQDAKDGECPRITPSVSAFAPTFASPSRFIGGSASRPAHPVTAVTSQKAIKDLNVTLSK